MNTVAQGFAFHDMITNIYERPTHYMKQWELRCEMMHQVLPRLQKKGNVQSLSNRTAEGVRDAPADITVLIASLQGRYCEELKDLYAEQPNEANAMIRFYQVSHLVRIVRGNISSQQYINFM